MSGRHSGPPQRKTEWRGGRLTYARYLVVLAIKVNELPWGQLWTERESDIECGVDPQASRAGTLKMEATGRRNNVKDSPRTDWSSLRWAWECSHKMMLTSSRILLEGNNAMDCLDTAIDVASPTDTSALQVTWYDSRVPAEEGERRMRAAIQILLSALEAAPGSNSLAADDPEAQRAGHSPAPSQYTTSDAPASNAVVHKDAQAFTSEV
jgi:hypothetical protein